MALTLKEMAALAMAGYKKKDIDPLIEKEEKEAVPADPAPADSVEENDPKEGAEDNPDPDNNGNDEIKAELEKTRAELEEVKKKLAAAQKDNVKKNIDSHTDEAAEREKRLQDYARKMM